MSRHTAESSWQRFLGWIQRNPQKSGQTGTAGSSHADEARELPKPKQVNAWEDEGGATAVRADGRNDGDSAAPAPPVDPTR
jgi:hypothetical protein